MSFLEVMMGEEQTREEIELKLSKIDFLESKIADHDVAIEIMKKRIKRMQDQINEMKQVPP